MKPQVGEKVAYYTKDGRVYATIVAVHAWDHVDLELSDGRIILDVRRVLSAHIKGADSTDVGRFERIDV